MEKRPIKDQLAHFGRTFALLLNRSMMYQSTHPFVQEAVRDTLQLADLILFKLSPLVFILNREQFYVDEEPLDERINVKRIVHQFKTAGIQSISFERGLEKMELEIFVRHFAQAGMQMKAEELKRALISKGSYNIRINHVTYKKVTEDDQVVSREALKSVTPLMDSEDQESRKKFLDALLESILTDEFSHTLNINSLLQNPAAFSKKMIEADMAGADQVQPVDDDAGPETLPLWAVDKGQGEGSGQTAEGGGAGSAPRGTGTGPGTGSGAGGGPASGQSGGAGPGVGGGYGSGTGPGAGSGTGPGTGGGTGSVQGDGMLTGTGPGLGAGHIPGPGGQGSAGAPDSSPAGAGLAAGAAAPAASGPSGAGPATGAMEAGADSEGRPAKGERHGMLLLHQLELMHTEVKKHLMGEGNVDLSDLAQAIFEMKKQLLEGIQTQKALGIAYANESTIIDNANALADGVLIELIKEEYRAGKITTSRLALIIRRLIPEVEELRRLLPQLKAALMEVGMPLPDYLKLINELQVELQNDELARILQESSEAIGVESEILFEEVRRNPDQAAELIYLASEIRKGTGDEGALGDILVDYVERISQQMALDKAGETDEGEGHLKEVMKTV
ncbi:MAG: hypothetical protein P8X55_00975, partial [Desulfosarcinaceae bacterium]